MHEPAMDVQRLIKALEQASVLRAKIRQLANQIPYAHTQAERTALRQQLAQLKAEIEAYGNDDC